jgi:tetratricopeptide (TPR) repeat protein
VWLMRGMGSLFTPTEYGGGARPAEEQLLKALELFKTDEPKAGKPAWGAAEVHLWLGQAYAQLGDKTKAAAEYKAALDMAPNFAYVKALAAALKP